MDVGLEMFIFMGVILKIPVLAACWLIWHAVRAEPEPVEGGEESGDERGRFRREPRPKRPRGPRRGPHAPDALPLPCPVGSDALRATRRPAHAALTGSAERR
ncbi:MAG: hypothetical protein KJ006_07220 [Thermoleophilia bacterium]|nr:hypothetical protein [Thermoleophilia bacterium]GIK76663.1 MAG: hypothetical protein BroJett022_03530 [Actinomycetes bacterium]